MDGLGPKERRRRAPSFALALLPVISLAVFLGTGYLIFDLPVEPLLIAAAACAAGVAIHLGYTWQEVADSIAEKIATTVPAILILLCVGIIIGSWMAGGTIPMLIHAGLSLISPRFLALIALIVTAVVALCTGTSWGAAGTIGVALMGVGIGVGANLAVVAGAVIAGGFFGDKLSPLSDTTNIASLAARVNLFEHIRHVLWTTGPAFLTSAAVYLIYGLFHATPGAEPEQVGVIMDALERGFRVTGIWVIPLLLPVFIVLGGALRKFPTIPVMLASATVATVNALLIQRISLQDVMGSWVHGFDHTMIDASLGGDVMELVDRGGMTGMMPTVIIYFCAIAFAGAFSVTPALDILIAALMRKVHSTFTLIAATIATGLATIGITANGQVGLLFPGQMLRPAYVERGLHPKNLSRTMEDSVTGIECLLPWTPAGVYMAGTLGVATLDYVPWAVSNWVAIGFSLLWAATGIGIAKLAPGEQIKTV